MTQIHPEEVEIVRAELREFYSAEEAEQWLTSPQRLLAGRTPLDAMRAGNVDEVFAVIDQLKSGAYV